MITPKIYERPGGWASRPKNQDVITDEITGFGFTQHAKRRMCARRITMDAVRAALDYGRVVYTRGAVIYILGTKELERCRKHGVDITQWDGLQVVCSHEGTILTAYRNKNLRLLRPRRHSRRRWHFWGTQMKPRLSP